MDEGGDGSVGFQGSFGCSPEREQEGEDFIGTMLSIPFGKTESSFRFF